MTYYQRADHKYELTLPLIWTIGPKTTFVIPRGFAFDVSVPKWLQWLVNPNDARYLTAACVHDFMLESGWKHNRAAVEFYQGLRIMGVGKVRSVLVAAVVLLWTS